jgi:hypothetical protein
MRTLLGAFAVVTALAFPAGALATIPAGNLVQNPGGEAAPGANDSISAPALPNWTTTPNFTAVQYGAPGFPTPAVSAFYGGGANFFAGGQNTTSSTALQDVDVRGAAPEIQGGNVRADFSAYLGGYLSQSDSATAAIQFLDSSGAVVRSSTIGPVTTADRNSESVLLPRSTVVQVPATTTTIRVLLQATRLEGSYDDGYADNVDVELAQGAPPVFGKTVDVAPVSGVVLIKTPGSSRFVPLSALKTIPVGATIDARKGRVRLTTTYNGKSQSSEFYEGVFTVFQRKADKGVVELVLAGGNFKPCPAVRGAASKSSSVRHLWGAGSGKFRTKGRFASATLRGTTWLTDDRCDGTLVRVTQGAVSVRDIPRRKTVLVRAPAKYLARAG